MSQSSEPSSKRSSRASWRAGLEEWIENSSIGEAKDFLRELFHRLNNLGEANFDVGKRMADSGKHLDAIIRFHICLKFSPNHAQAHAMLAHCYVAKGQTTKALKHLQQAIALNPQDERCIYMLATLDSSLLAKELMPRTMPYEMMLEYFNNVAEQYEFMQQSQQYRAHLYADQALWDELDRRRRDYVVLELGCGTGLCGQLLAEHTEDLVGVDFAHKMIDIARMKRRPDGSRIYPSLVYQDIRNYFQDSPPEAYFDAVVACHVLHYIGEIGSLFDGIVKVLKPEGIAVLQVESYDKVDDFGLLKGKGRFGHGDGYMRQQCQRVGLSVIAYHGIQVYPDYQMVQYVVRKL